MKIITLVISLLFISNSLAQSRWNMATPYKTTQFSTINIQKFLDEIQQKTNNQLHITLHSGGTLYRPKSIFKAVSRGQVHMGELLISSLGDQNPIFTVDTLPFIATDYDSARKLWSVSKSTISDLLEEKGVKLLFTVPWPGQNFYTLQPIQNAEYFQGKKLRTYNATTSEIASNLGAIPTPVEAANIPEAFNSGQIDAMITSSSTGVSSGSWNFLSDYTKVNAWLPKNMVFINKKAWEKLDASTQAIILEAAANAEKNGWQLSEEINSKNEQTLADNGVRISEASDALKASLKAIGEIMSKQWLDTTGYEGQAILDAYYR